MPSARAGGGARATVRLLVVAAALAVATAVTAGCEMGGYACDCAVPNRALAQQVFCGRAHDCRASYQLSDEAFVTAYGEDLVACFNGPSLAEVDLVMTHAPTPEPPFVNYDEPEMLFWRLLMNCLTALGRASCDEVASGALLEDGDYCGDDVMQGLAHPPADVGAGCCYESLDIPE